MPPVVVAAGIAGAATLGGAALASRASNKATSAQKDSTDAALAFTKDQEAYKRQSYEQAMDLYRQQYNASQARRDAYLNYLGFSMPSDGNLTLGTPALPQSGYTAQQPAVASGGIRSLMSAAPEAQRANIGSLDDVYRGPWSDRWAE